MTLLLVRKPAVDTRLLVRGKRFSSICAMDVTGIVDVFTTKGSVNADTFCDFVESDLALKLMPFDGKIPRSVVLMDNVKFHHSSQVLAAIEGTGALVHFLPPYSPDLNPAEEVFSKSSTSFSRMMRSLKVQLRRSLMISFYKGFVQSQRMIAMVTLSMQDTHDAVM